MRRPTTTLMLISVAVAGCRAAPPARPAPRPAPPETAVFDLGPIELAARRARVDRESAELDVTGWVASGLYTRKQGEDVLHARSLLLQQVDQIPDGFVGMVGCTVEGQLVFAPDDCDGGAVFKLLDAVNPPGRLGWAEYFDRRAPGEPWSPR